MGGLEILAVGGAYALFIFLIILTASLISGEKPMGGDDEK